MKKAQIRVPLVGIEPATSKTGYGEYEKMVSKFRQSGALSF